MRRGLAGVTAAAWVLSGPAAIGVAADGEGNVEIQNTETVQVYTDASGKVDTKRVYEQLVLTGHGKVDFSNPVSTEGLRNLDGFSGFDVKDGAEQISTSVDGQERLRSLSDYNGDLPLEVTVMYLLDGKEVSPGDVIGKSGDLEVKYHVENVTGETQQIEVSDGRGGTVTQGVDVVLPMVGSLTTVLPSNFTETQSDQANIAGDGRGGTKMTFTMTLVPPIGSATADFGYTAKITDGVIPDATMSALPVSPLASASLKKAADSYQGGSQTGADLTAGASEIDANLLRLRDGAQDLTKGVMKLYAGAGQLSDGLNNDAVPGTRQLAGGSSKLADGATTLAAGSGDLVGGLNRLRDGTGDLLGGTRDLRDGAVRIRNGVSDLNDGAVRLRDGAARANDGAVRLRNGAGDLRDGAVRLNAGALQFSGGQDALAEGLRLLYRGVDTLPEDVRAQLATNTDYQTLLGTLTALVNGIGSVGDSPASPTLLGGMNAIEYAMRYPPAAGLDCAVALGGGTPTKCGAMDGVDYIADQLSTGAAALTQLKGAIGSLADNNGCLIAAAGPPAVPAPPDLQATLDCKRIATLYYGLFSPDPTAAGAQAKVLLAAAKLKEISAKVDDQLLDNDGDPEVEGLPKLRRALSNGSPATCNRADPAAADACGVAQALLIIRAGVPELVDTLTNQISTELKANIGVPTVGCDPTATLRCAAAALTNGGEDLAAGSQQLAAGSRQLADGTVVLADGTRQLADGTLVLTDGTRRLSDGTVQLADGTLRLAGGANQLNDGAVKLQDGGVRLQDGAQQLSSGAGLLDGGLQQLLAGVIKAADGSNLLRDGLQTAADGAPKISKGATKLSKQGTQKLVDAGSKTTVEFGTKYAQLKAGAERADKDSMAFGAPEGAQGLTAYTYEIRGEDGEGTRNWGRGIAGVAIFGLGAGVYALRRRLL